MAGALPSRFKCFNANQFAVKFIVGLDFFYWGYWNFTETDLVSVAKLVRPVPSPIAISHNFTQLPAIFINLTKILNRLLVIIMRPGHPKVLQGHY